MNDAAHPPTTLSISEHRNRSGALDFVVSVLARSAGAPLAFAANILLARLLGPANFGLYMTLLSAGLVAGGIAAYGVGPVLTREIAIRPRDAHAATVASMSRWALRLTGLLSLGAMGLLLVWLTFGPAAPPNHWTERLAAVGVIPVSVWAILASGVLGGLSQVAKSQALGNALKNGFLLLGAAVLLLFGMRRVVDVLWLQFVSYVLIIAIDIYWVRQSIPAGSNQTSTTPPVAAADAANLPHRIWRRSAGHFFAMSAAMLVLSRLDVVIVNAIAGQTEAGLFGVAARLGQIAATAGLVWIAWLQPRMAHQSWHGQWMALKRTLRLGIFGSAVSTGILVGLSWVGAPYLVSLLGNGFSGSIWPFRWLLLGYLVWGISVPHYVFLTMSQREKLVSWILWFQAALTLMVSLPLISRFGAIGGSWAWAGGMTIASVSMMVATRLVEYRPSSLITDRNDTVLVHLPEAITESRRVSSDR